MGNINVSYLQENNFANDFTFAGSRLGVGVDWQLGEWPLTAGLSLGVASGDGTTKGLKPKIWSAGVELELKYKINFDGIKTFIAARYSIGGGRIKYEEALEAIQPCPFLSSCQWERMLGVYSTDRFSLGMDIEWNNLIVSGGVATQSFDGNEGVLLPCRSVGWYLGGGLRL